MTALADRLEELRRLAERRGVADQVGDLPSAELAVSAYAEALGLDTAMVHNLDMSLKDIERFSTG